MTPRVPFAQQTLPQATKQERRAARKVRVPGPKSTPVHRLARKMEQRAEWPLGWRATRW